MERTRSTTRTARTLDTSKGANQADAKATNVNALVAQFQKHGTLPNVAQKNPLYGDYTFPEDIHSMREAVYEAEQRFKELPSAVRALSNHDWVEFLERFENPEAREELLDAGLRVEIPETTIPNTTTTTTPTTETPETTPTTPATETPPASTEGA